MSHVQISNQYFDTKYQKDDDNLLFIIKIIGTATRLSIFSFTIMSELLLKIKLLIFSLYNFV